MHEADTCGWADNSAPRVEPRIRAAQRGELRSTLCGIAGLIEHPVAGRGDLVTADHNGIGTPGGDRLSLGERQPQGSINRGLAGNVLLAGVRPGRLEGHAKALEQRAPVRRGGGENQGMHDFRDGDSRNRLQETTV